MRRLVQRTLSQLAFIIILVGALVFVLTFLSGKQDQNKEVSLFKVQGIIVSETYILIGLAGSSRIQQYNLKGEFIKGWETKTFGKEFTFKIQGNKPLVLQKHLNRKQAIEFYNSELMVDSLQNLAFHTIEFQQVLNPNLFVDADENEYFISGLFFKKLMKKKGELEEIIVKQSYFLNFFSGTSTPLFFLSLGILFFTLLNLKTITQHMISHKNEPKLLQLILKILT